MRGHDVGGIRPGQHAVQVFGDVLPGQAPDEEGQGLGVAQQMLPLRLRPVVEDVVGGQPEGMEAVLLDDGKPHLGTDIIDAGGQVGHL